MHSYQLPNFSKSNKYTFSEQFYLINEKKTAPHKNRILLFTKNKCFSVKDLYLTWEKSGIGNYEDSTIIYLTTKKKKNIISMKKPVIM